MYKLSLCICTAKRSQILERLLVNISEQVLIPDEILVVDGAKEISTKDVVMKCNTLFPKEIIKYIPSDLGLTFQRNVGIDNSIGEYICMLDDDVILEPDCLESMINFLDSKAGLSFAAISAYITNEYGRDFYKLERLFHKIGIYDGELKPGRWLYCGEFLELSTLKPFDGIYESQALPAGAAMFRKRIIEKVRPIPKFNFGGEDKHWTLRISNIHKIGVLGNAKLVHEHVASGVRKPKIIQGAISARNRAIILSDCDPNPSYKRYIVFMLYSLFKNSINTILIILTFKWNDGWIIGQWAGWFKNFIKPKRSNNN
jgi:glycosyltransferase involved in cell wall biosynthesis